MATISQYLSQIKSAIYGSEVRDSIHEALSAINQQTELAQNVAVESQNSAAQMAINAENSATAAAQSATDAAGSYDTANQAATAAANSATEASQYVTTAEMAKIVANADSSYDTLKEIADWIQSHSSSASAMNSSINALEAKFSDMPETFHTVKEMIQYICESMIDTLEQEMYQYIDEHTDSLPVLPVNPGSSYINSFPEGTIWIVTE